MGSRSRPVRTFRGRCVHEAARRRRLAIVLPLLLRRVPQGHASITALGRLLRLCGVAPSERYLAQVLATCWNATRGRLRLKVTRRRAVVWFGVVLRPGGVTRARVALAAEYEAALAEAGLPGEVAAMPSWRQLSAEQLTDLTSGRGRRVLVRLPADGDDPGVQGVETRARNFLADALAAGAYNHCLEELLWRGSWRSFPPWHRQLLAAHLMTGVTMRAWSRQHGVSYLEAKRALQLHRARAGLRPGD